MLAVGNATAQNADAMAPMSVTTDLMLLTGAVVIGTAMAKNVRKAKVERGPMKMGLTIRCCPDVFFLLLRNAASSNKHHNLSPGIKIQLSEDDSKQHVTTEIISQHPVLPPIAREISSNHSNLLNQV